VRWLLTWQAGRTMRRPATAAAAAAAVVLAWLQAAAADARSGASTPACPSPAGPEQMVVVITDSNSSQRNGSYYSWAQCALLRSMSLPADTDTVRPLSRACVVDGVDGCVACTAGSTHAPLPRAPAHALRAVSVSTADNAGAALAPTHVLAERWSSPALGAAPCGRVETAAGPANGHTTEAINETKHAGNVVSV